MSIAYHTGFCVSGVWTTFASDGFSLRLAINMLNRLAVVLLACFSLGFHYSIDVRADPAELPADCTYIFNQGTGLCLYHNPGRPGSAFLIDCTRDDAETTIGHFWRVVPTDLPLDEPQYPHSRGVPVHIQACREWYPSDPPVELHVLSRQSTGAVSMMDLFTMSDSSDAIWYSWRGQLWSYDATRALSVSASGPYLALIGRVQFAWSAQSVEDSADPEQWQESEKNGVLEHHCPSCLFNTTITWTYESPTVQVRPRRRSHQASDRNLCMIAPQRHPYETYWYGLFNDRTLMVFNGCDERSPHNGNSLWVRVGNQLLSVGSVRQSPQDTSTWICAQLVVENSRSYHYQKWLAAVRCEGSHGVDSSVLLSTGSVTTFHA